MSQDPILNDLKTLSKLKDIGEDKTIMIDSSSCTSPSFYDHKFGSYIKYFFKKTYDTLFPPNCFICEHNQLENDQTHVCNDCKSIFSDYVVESKFYDKDNKEIGLGIFRYDGLVRFFMQKMKFGKKKNICHALSEMSEPYFREFLHHHHINYIVPIPSHKDRIKERGFNQAEVIAKDLAQKTGVPIRTNLIIRSKYTVPQSKLSNEERKENVKNSFKILDENEIMGKDILLLDDIYTTGSTIEECSKVLYEHNTRKVYFLSISVSNNKLKGECNDEN